MLMKRFGLLLSLIVFCVLMLISCANSNVTEKNFDNYQPYRTSLKEVILKDQQGKEVEPKKGVSVVEQEIMNDAVVTKISMIPSRPNQVRAYDENTNQEIRISKWEDGYPVVPYPRRRGIFSYKIVATWNETNEFHVHEAIVRYEIENK
jgi:hypothetical protein